jgi:hypothetical protein
MLDYFIAPFLFNPNLVISIRRRTTTLEIIVESVVVNVCKSYKLLERKSCAKTLLSSTNAKLLLSSSTYISSILSTTTLELATTSYTIY